MKISINRCIEGTRTAEGITVMMDIFRASNTIISCLTAGAAYIIPVGDLNDAYKLKEKHPDHLLFGERNGIPPAGFDHDNSPAGSAKLDLKDKKIILTTSAGSQGIVYAKKADKILIGSFANAKAIASYLISENPRKITLLAIGNNAVEPATEDEECATYIRSLLLDKENNFDQIKNRILVSDGANRLRRLKQYDDLKLCLQLNTSKIIPMYDVKTGRILKAE